MDTGGFYVVRTRDSGVHMGKLEGDVEGQRVTLTGARRLWRWKGANTLNEVSQRGVDEDWTRISEPVPRITLLDAIELIEASRVARLNLTRSRWG